MKTIMECILDSRPIDHKELISRIKSLGICHQEGNKIASKTVIIKNKKQRNNKVKVKKVITTKELPDSLIIMPGIAGKIKNYIDSISDRPNDSYSIAGALSAMSIINDNYYQVVSGSRERKTALNLYFLIAGLTGSGKESPRKGVKNLISSVKDDDILVEELTSGPALLNGLIKSPSNSLAILSDEFGRLLVSANRNKSGSLYDFLTVVMKLYGLATSNYSGKLYASESNRIPKINKPYVNLLTTTTPSTLNEAITPESISDGFLNRFMVVIKNDMSKRSLKYKKVDLDFFKKWSRELLKQQAFHKYTDNSNAEHKYIVLSEGSEKLLEKFKDEIENKLSSELYSRVVENTIKIAGVLAIGDNLEKPIIDEISLTWAINFVTWCIENIENNVKANLVNAGEDGNIKKLLKLITNCSINKSDHNNKKWPALIQQGYHPKARVMQYMNITSNLVELYIKTLVAQEKIKVSKENNIEVLYAI